MSVESNKIPRGDAGSGIGPRRFFLKTLGVGTGALGLAGSALSGSARAVVQAATVTDVDIANFALNLEYLEAEYYTFAVTGASIEALGIPTTGVNTGGGNPGPIVIKANPKVPFASDVIRQYATEIAIDEQKHVLDFRAALGAQAVARPAVDLLNSFAALGALIGVPGFDPFANDLNFLIGAYIFEDVGVSSFHGAAPLIRSTALLDTAAGILAVEGEHAGLIRTVLFQMGQGPVTDAISDVRRMLGGSVDYGVDNGPLARGPKGTASVFLSDINGMAPARTFRQVLNILYGGVNAPSGGFFPAGLNGTIR